MPNETKKPQIYSDIVAKDLMSINAKIEISKPLKAGAIVFSINGGESFAELTSENQTSTISNQNACFGVLLDGIEAAGESAVLIAGELNLADIASELKIALFKQKIVIKG
ncbi:hypothetical protein CPIN18020_0230 [Campylobacter pinnipediorum subsp. caledonicus]|uniref:hypothetical protein n=1 Tax=Campylobacter pinnipediorum TaxID=1965231 RepID=UPI0009959E50|nr:hypothetical protein [Campylobacter pinnipediorum]AQW85477.1 hypothetical protein CPIN18020_0230 [Campylobacter pinnipediorum subsp. caledonicus]